MTRVDWGLYAAATLAEANYTAAVVLSYGKDACNARYDYARNGSRPTSALHPLYVARIGAIEAWRTSVRVARGKDSET